MLNIAPYNIVNTRYLGQNKNVSFKNPAATSPDIKLVNNSIPDFEVKTPIGYVKTGEINLPYDLKAHCYKLSNGQRVIILPKEGSTVLKTYVNTGSMNEPDKLRGISHYIEHNLFNGSDGLDDGQFFNEVNKIGASTNASTGFAETNYYIKSNLINDSDLEHKIKIHASMLQTPHFAVNKLEKEKGVVNSEINMILSDCENIALNHTVKNLYDIKSTSNDLIGGSTDNITNLTGDDVIKYFNDNYYPSNMITVVTGEVEPDETIKLLSKYFNSNRIPANNRHFEKLTPLTNPKREDIISDKASAAHVTVGFDGPNNSNTREKIATELAAEILFQSSLSRTYKALKPYNTSVFASSEDITCYPDNKSALLLTAECSDENSEKVIKTIYNEINKIQNFKPSDDEIKVAKRILLKNYNKIFENSFGINSLIGESVLKNDENYLKNYADILNSITPEEITQTAKKYFDLNKAALTVIHPAKTTKEEILNNYKNAENINFKGKIAGKKEQVINLSKVNQFKFPNNIEVLTNDTNYDNTYSIINFKCDEFPKSKASAMLLLNIILNEGSSTKNQAEYDYLTAKEGISNVFYAGKKGLRVNINAPSDSLKNAFAYANEVLKNPAFNDETFEYAKKQLENNLKNAEKSVYDKLGKELYPNLPYNLTKDEILKDLETVTLDDVKDFYNQITENAQANITVSAPFSKKPYLKNDVFNEILSMNNMKEFKPKTYKNIHTPNTKSKVLTDIDNKNQAKIVMAYKYLDNKNIKDSTALNLLNIILGENPSSRLFKDLREKEKLAYTVKSSIDSTENSGCIALYIGTTTENKETGETSYDNLQKSIEGFKRNIEKIKSENVSQEELDSAKLTLKNDLLSVKESTSTKNNMLNYDINSTYGVTRTNMIYNIIDSITADDIRNAANYIFKDKPVYSIIATENTLKFNENYLNSLVD